MSHRDILINEDYSKLDLHELVSIWNTFSSIEKEFEDNKVLAHYFKIAHPICAARQWYALSSSYRVALDLMSRELAYYQDRYEKPNLTTIQDYDIDDYSGEDDGFLRV